MHFKKVLSIIITTLIITLLLTACSNEPSIYVDKDDSPLKIYIPDNNEFIKYHIDKFNEAHETTQIEYDVIASNYFSVTYKKLEEKFREGKGPDLIFIDKSFMSHRNIIKMAKDGLFADMDMLIKRSLAFDSDLYNMDVLDTGIIDNIRAFMPVTYRIDVIAVSNINFEKHNLEIPSELTLDTLLDIWDTYYAYANKRRVFASMLGIDTYSLLSAQINDLYCIDNSPEIDKLITYMHKERYGEYSWAMQQSHKQNNIEFYDIYFDLDKLFTTVCGGEDFYSSLYYQYNVFKNQQNSEMIYYKHPLTAQKTSLYFDQGFAINANSDKKNKAFKFIEYMLSEEVQSGNLYAPTLPVNEYSYAQAKEKLLSNDYSLFSDVDFNPTPFPTDLANKFIDVIENTKCEFNNYYIINRCIGNAFFRYMDGKIEKPQVIFEINNNLDFYYNGEEE